MASYRMVFIQQIFCGNDSCSYSSTNIRIDNVPCSNHLDSSKMIKGRAAQFGADDLAQSSIFKDDLGM